MQRPSSLSFLLLCGLGLVSWPVFASPSSRPAQTPSSQPSSLPSSALPTTPILPTSPAVKPAPPALPKAPAVKPTPPAVNPASSWAQAILINGGGEARSNYYSHVLYLRMMHQVLQEVGFSTTAIDIFASDGEDPAPDQAIVTEKRPLESWLFSGRKEEMFYRLRPRLINTEITGVSLQPATKKILGPAFQTLAAKVKNDPRPLFVFVTDHGMKNRKEGGDRNNFISLWKEELSVREYHKLLRPFGARRIVSVMSQCYSGSFAWSVFRKPGRISIPQGDRCGFFATLPDRLSYGCFPDTRLKQGIGHAFHFIEAMRQAETMEEAHRQVLLTDQTPDIPLRSSDAFLYLLIRDDAEAEEIKPEERLVKLFQKYGKKTYPGMQDDLGLISSIASRFHLPRPLSVEALLEQKKQLRKKLAWWERVETMWQEALTTTRDHHLQRLYESAPKLRQEVTRLLAAQTTPRAKNLPRGRALEEALKRFRERLPKLPDVPLTPATPSQGRRRRVQPQDFPWSEELTKQRLREAFLLYVQSRPTFFQRLQDLRDKKEEMRRYVFRLQVQIAALERIEILFYRMAGRLQLHHSPHPDHKAYLQGFQNLQACEATRIAPPSLLVSKPPPLEPIRLFDREPPLPSWFGISFRPVPRGRYPFLPPGAVTVETVYRKTPAAEAGILEGDIIVSFGGRALQEPFEIRERVMRAPLDPPTPLLILRNDELITVPLKFQRLVTPPSMLEAPLLGLRVPSLSSLSALSSLDPTKPPPAALSKGASLLFFWATWCGPCKAALPALRLFQQRYPNLQIVTVSNEDPATIQGWLTKNPTAMPFLNLADTERLLFSRLRIRATPSFLLLKNGEVSFVHVGFSKMDDLETQIKKLLP